MFVGISRVWKLPDSYLDGEDSVREFKQSSLLEYRGGLTSASGGMQACVPGHMVSGVIRGFMPSSLDIPKSVTFARVPSPISRTLLLERSLWMMLLE